MQSGAVGSKVLQLLYTQLLTLQNDEVHALHTHTLINMLGNDRGFVFGFVADSSDNYAA
eukprot:COSAG02_NODE_27959_length_599_cov_1.022000_2_plen_59_part_00